MRRASLLVTILLCAITGSVWAQQQLQEDPQFKKNRRAVAKMGQSATVAPVAGVHPNHNRCGFTQYMNRAKAQGFSDERYEAAFKQLIQQRIQNGRTAFTGIVTIPVIFHVVYRTGDALSTSSPNLTAAMFQAQIAQMNKDYGNLSGSAYGVASDVRIRFCMAVVDTAGRPLSEAGIERINGSSRSWSNTNTMSETAVMDYLDTLIKPASIWDPYSYFNVWTCAMNTSGLLGYSTFPSFSTLSGLDNGETSRTAGCVINWVSVGSETVPGYDLSYGLGRTLTHESGHFFGLRHIWGDDTCGDDYCADTPPQDDATSGCPATGTLNNCTPSGPKMFENYMDYTDDACVNTFTANQALRCQTAMDNSPRRFTLMSSKACSTRAANSIQFANLTGYITSETGTAGSCPNSRTYSFKLYVSGAATGAATVTFQTTGSTATLGADYTISPASVTYTNGDNAAKTISITVNDDQIVEANEDIKISYTISGSGVVAGIEKQTLTLTIADDDIPGTTINNGSPVKTILSQNFNASTNIPTGWTTSVYDDGSATYIPNQWVVSANGGTGTSGNAAHVTRSTSTKTNQYNNVNTSDAYLFTPLLDATGVRDINLSFKWRCLGEPGYDEGYIGYIPEGTAVSAENVIYFNTYFGGLSAATSAPTASLNLPPSLNNTRFYLVFNWFNDNTIGSNPPFTVDDITMTGKYFSVASTTDADTAFLHYAGQTVDYYSKTTTSPVTYRLLARIANPSQDLGCVTASVQSQGTGKTVLTTISGSYFRSDKVIKITPASASSSTTYTGTFYFTTAELSTAWTAAEIPTLKILKVKDGVDIFGVLTSADAELVTPVFSDQSATGGYYSYTGNFTGFSQFMLVSPNTTLPVNLLSFEVFARKNSILLNWATSAEQNNKGFAVERSIDGQHFERIGWVSAAGAQSASSYQFADNFVQPNTVYYYRLAQTDLDNTVKLSAIRQARIGKTGLALVVSPIPAHQELNVFVSGATQNGTVQLLNIGGQSVRTWNQLSLGLGNQRLSLSGIPSGVYMLQVATENETLIKKVIIE